MKTLLVVLLCLSADPAFVPIKLKPDAPEEAKAHFARFDDERRKEITEVEGSIGLLEREIAQAESDLALCKKARLLPGLSTDYAFDEKKKQAVFKNAKVRKEHTDKLTDRIAIRKTEIANSRARVKTLLTTPTFTSSVPASPVMPTVLKIGNRGEIRHGMNVLQVVNKDEVRVEMQGLLLSPSGPRADVWLKLPMHGFVDGQKVPAPKGVFTVSGTKQYETAAGASRTVFVLELAKVKPQEDFSKYLLEPPK